MIFAPPHYLSRVKGYSQLLLCEARKRLSASVIMSRYPLLWVLTVIVSLKIQCRVFEGVKNWNTITGRILTEHVSFGSLYIFVGFASCGIRKLENAYRVFPLAKFPIA